MATYYVNKSGSAGNNGTTVALAKLTIAQGIALTSNGDTVVVGSGSYNERITWNCSSKGITLMADGVVVMDGAGLAAGVGAISLVGSGNMAASLTNSITTAATGGQWILKNYNVNAVSYGLITTYIDGGVTTYTVNLYLNQVMCIGNVNNTVGLSQYNLAYGGNVGARGNQYLTSCIFTGFSSYGCYNLRGTSAGGAVVHQFISATYCTFYNCVNGMYSTASTSGQSSIYGTYNIFHTCTTGVYNQNNPTTLLDYNDYYGCTYLANVNGTTYATLALWQATGAEPHGVNTDPGLIDPANQVFFLSSIGAYGALPYSAATRGASYNPDAKWIITAAKDDTGWYCAGGNIAKNGTTGFFELVSGTVDTIESPIFDLGSVQTVTGISLASDQTFPTNMADYDKTDVRPNYQKVEVRAQNASFVQADASPSWVVVNVESPLTNPSGRYCQLRITLRNDDVGA